MSQNDTEKKVQNKFYLYVYKIFFCPPQYYIILYYFVRTFKRHHEVLDDYNNLYYVTKI